MRALAVIGAILVAAAAQAQDRMDRATCIATAESFVALTEFDGASAETVLDADGWCRTTGLSLDAVGASRLVIGNFRWRGTGFARFLNEGLPPTGIEVSATEIVTVFETGDPVFDYALGIQRAGATYSVTAVVRWDALQKSLFVDDVTLLFGQTNSIGISGRIDDIDLTDRATLQASLGLAGLSSLKLDMRFDGWFESILLLPLAQLLLNDGPPVPAVQVAGLKQVAAAFLAEVPSEILPGSSEEGLVRFINALPAPKGRLRLEVTASEPIGAAQLSPFLFSASEVSPLAFVTTVLSGSTFVATWEAMP